MSPTASSLDIERIGFLLLARLLPTGKRRLSKTEAIGSVHELLTRALGSSVEKQQVEAAFERCVARGFVAQEPLALADEGRETLRNRLGVRQLPTVKDWRAVQQKLIPMLVFGTELRTKGKPAERIAAAIVAQARGVPAADRSLKGVIDGLAWRALGRESSAPFDAASVQRWLLRELVDPDVRIKKAADWRRLVAAKLIGAQRPDADAMQRALLGQWLARAPSRTTTADTAVVTPPERPTAHRPGELGRADAGSLSSFAKSVLHAARMPGVSRFHDDRAFIGSIWEHMREQPPVRGMTLDAFKDQLVKAHRKGLIRMTRADLVGAMDPAELQRSEARYLDASFHFVALEPETEPAL